MKILGELSGEAAPAGRILAYHGTPHTLPAEPGFPLGRFKLENIGTGEGAQAYGWGVPYLAENADVALEYKRNIKNPELAVINDRLSALAKEMAALEKPGQWRQYREPRGYELADEYDNLLTKRTDLGRLYEVDIPEGPYLDWDAPLSGQPDLVRRELERAPLRLRQGWKESGAWPDHVRGSTLYDHLADSLTGSRQTAGHKYASGLLGERGVAGIRYLDQGSRGAGEGTRNYVMFDPDLVNIRALRALPFLLGGGGALGALAAHERQSA